MGIVDRILRRSSDASDHYTSSDLRAIWDRYADQWPENNDRYRGWKPTSALPAPKWVIKRAMKLCYAEWPEPIDWAVFSPFFMEFVDLAMHLPQAEFEAIQSFREKRVMCGATQDNHDPLMHFIPQSVLATTRPIEWSLEAIVRVRDGLRRSPAWNPVEVDDGELSAVRRIVLASTVEYEALIYEWRFYILSIGRDTCADGRGRV
jgi:hypothetical protein